MAADAPPPTWDERYAAAGDEYLFGTEPNAFLAAQQSRLMPGRSALAVADGEGRNGVWLARQGLDVTSVDISPAAIAKGRRLAARHGVGVRFECADLVQWDWGRPRFDLVVAIFIQVVPPPVRDLVFRRMKGVLRPGGLLLLEGYRTDQLKYRTGGPPQIENLYTEALLRSSFADMELLHLAAYDAEINEGARHRGMSALIDLVARKPG